MPQGASPGLGRVRVLQIRVSLRKDEAAGYTEGSAGAAVAIAYRDRGFPVAGDGEGTVASGEWQEGERWMLVKMPKDAPLPGKSLTLDVRVSTIENWRKEAFVRHVGTEGVRAPVFSFVSDEGHEFPGGEGSAPPPLAYFAASVGL